jgi:hypothetical protein
MTAPAPTSRRGDSWIVFAGIMLMIAGIVDFFNGLYALDRSDTAIDALFFENDLETWGWFYVVVGVVLFAAGLAVFARAQWARWVGVIAASLGVIVNMFWVFQYPIASLVLVLLNALVVYGLVIYGEREDVY